MKKIQSKMKVLDCTHAYRSFFFRRSRAANSAVRVEIPLKFELVQALMVVPVTCKNEEDPIKNEGSRCQQDIPHYKYMFVFFFKRSRAANSVIQSGQNLNSSKILWLSSFPGRMKKIQSKMKALECYQDFFSDAQGQITPKSVVEFR